MSTYTTKKIPVSNHIYKYLHYLYGSSYTYSRSDFLGNMIFGMMKPGYRLTYSYKLDTTYSIKLSKDDIQRMGRVLEWENCIDFNKGINSFFQSTLFFYLDMVRKVDEKSVYPSMVQSLTEMNITEKDIQYDSLYRQYKRKCNYKKNTRINLNYFNKNSSEDLSCDFGRFVHE